MGKMGIFMDLVLIHYYVLINFKFSFNLMDQTARKHTLSLENCKLPIEHEVMR